MSSRRAIVWLVLAALVAVVTGSSGSFGRGSSSSGSYGSSSEDGFGDAVPSVARVARVVDGDTIIVAAGGRTERVRYIGMDTPESVKPNTPVQCFAEAASAENQRLVGGQTVRLVLDREHRDRYGRLLAYVYRAGDGEFVNAKLVQGGYARTLEIPPNDRFAGRFNTLQTEAQRADRGLWGRC